MRFRLPMQLYPQVRWLFEVGDRVVARCDVGRRWLRAFVRWDQGV